ncbi:MAG: hypothetical protein KBB55_00170 [Candidatus Buchananbacteria bacterium]|nr:hypothetical protein [Candidatus Buchananbacteria bacterium]
MYHYVYDAALNDPRHHKLLARIETRLTDLGIAGSITRLAAAKNTAATVRRDLQPGLSTIVVVGTDRTLGEIINIAVDPAITFGFIPIGPSAIADLMGINQDKAAEILSSRLVATFALGCINTYRFITTLEIKKTVSITVNKQYRIETNNQRVTITNMSHQRAQTEIPTLEVHMQPAVHRWQRTTEFTQLHADHLEITAPIGVTPIVLTDEGRSINTPAQISCLPQALKLIVGRDRLC